MSKTYIFDVDGTLTPSRQTMTEDFSKFFDKWSKKNTYWLVSGSDLKKMQEQIPIAYLDRAEGLFCCGANELYQNGNLMYEKSFNVPKPVVEFLLSQVSLTAYPYDRAKNNIENRKNMLNFSVIGRDCTQEQRDSYYHWDMEHKERFRIANTINNQWPLLEATIGGQISIDIAPRGNNKSQVLDVVKSAQKNVDEFIFIGDRTMSGGNDYPLAELMNRTNGCKVFQTEGANQTMEILEWLEQ
tara:strand:+ start:458 stop:1183 length:726 start_codon:yes stop_codon:yes gene_type:complete